MNGIVRTRRGAVLIRKSVWMEAERRRASSWAIMPPIETPAMFRSRCDWVVVGGKTGDVDG